MKNESKELIEAKVWIENAKEKISQKDSEIEHLSKSE